MAFSGVTIKASPWKVGALVDLKRDGKLMLPDLQRGFVWSAERVRSLLDSLYRRYPVGALLLWKPTWRGQEAPFVTRAWDLALPDPSGAGKPEGAPPVLPGACFVLDGQQRLTSLFRVIFGSRLRGGTAPDPDLLVALSPEPEWVDAPFHLRTRQLAGQLRQGLLVPAEVLFGGESRAIQNALRDWVDPTSPLFFQALDRANALRTAILSAEIVAYEIDADAEDDNVIEIFARLNQQGVRLRAGDLAAARLTGVMKGFRERAREALSLPALSGFAMQEGAEESRGAFVDTDLIVRTALFLQRGVLRYGEAERRDWQGIEQHWPRAVEALTKTVAMYKKAGIPDGSWLPYRYLLLVPAVSFAAGEKIPSTTWLGWAIAASLWSHYGSSAETRAQADAAAAEAGQTFELFEAVKKSARRLDTLIPDTEDITGNVPNAAGVLLGLLVWLARTKAVSFPSKRPLLGGGEPVEVHGLFPRAALDDLGWSDRSTAHDRLGNLTLLFRSDVERVSGRLPRAVLGEVPAEVLEQHGIPKEPQMWEVPRYAQFCTTRERALATFLVDLLKSYAVP